MKNKSLNQQFRLRQMHVIITMLLCSSFWGNVSNNSSLCCSVIINEVDYCNQVVELHNPTDFAIDVSSYWMCRFPSYVQISSLVPVSGDFNIDPGDYLVLGWSGIETNDGELGLYSTNSFGSSSAIIDYVQYNSANNTRSGVAVAAGVWDNTSNFVSANSCSNGTTISVSNVSADSGSLTDSNDWCNTSPSLGSINNSCPSSCNDPCFAEFGTSNPCITFIDSDNDGTCDNDDGCPDDPNKTDPGICGCGIADTDTDSDGTPDCNDGCPEDPNKTDPGICGCGIADTDTDSDGTPDCNDGCPEDPNKTEPGICGCGIADTDSDSDGTPDCNDGCPDDPNKTDPGICGCGIADTDTDSDGTPDCNDGCPEDPNKIDPGLCGCGIADTDTDSDGTPDCNDGCPDDPNKTDPGICGCGIADTDTDSDGTPDCNDGCPDDPNKTEPGVCGCGISDVDTDSDSIEDCIDPCPEDETNTCNDCNDPCFAEFGTNAPCSNFVDSDADGTCDFNDGCPDDPNKTEPGLCGCGIADTDTDSDGTPDCNDGCPEDPNKTDPGICGCGIADTDTDSDGTPDCNDGCPEDPNKTEPGICGCGIADTDSDSDGWEDCIDNCPTVFNPDQELFVFYADGDLDGFGDENNSTMACAIPPGHSDISGDCDDTDPNVNPGAPEVCLNDIDDNCNGIAEEGCEDCISANFVNPPNGLLVEQNNTKTRFKWNHYSDATDGCLIETQQIDELGYDVGDPITFLISGPVKLAGDLNGHDKSGAYFANETFTIFNDSQFPEGPIASWIPSEMYKFKVKCGCAINPELPLPDRVQPPNIHMSPWSDYEVFTNLESFFDSELDLVYKIEDFEFQISIFPNPANDAIKVNMEVDFETDALLFINDLYGRRVLSFNLNLIKGNNSVVLDISMLESGFYQMVVVANKFRTDGIIIKQD